MANFLDETGLLKLWNKTKTYIGNATVAVAKKLATARTITIAGDFHGNFKFDGNSDVTCNLYNRYAKLSIGNTNNYLWHRIAKVDVVTTSYTDKTMTMLITQDYNGGRWGIARVSLRTNNSTTKSSVVVDWLVRNGFNESDLQCGIYNVYGATYADLFLKSSGSWSSTVIRVLESGARGSVGKTWDLIESAECDGTTSMDKKTSFECWKTIAEAAQELHKQDYSEITNGYDNSIVRQAVRDGSGNIIVDTYAKKTDFNNHTGNKNNPHGVTKSQVGLENVENKSSATIRSELTQANVTAALGYTPPKQDTNTWRGIQNNLTSDATDQSLSAAQGKALNTNLTSHIGNKSNPHGVTKTQLGLANVENKSSATIRGEITASNVNTALGYTAAKQADANKAITAISASGTTLVLTQLDGTTKYVTAELVKGQMIYCCSNSEDQIYCC